MFRNNLKYFKDHKKHIKTNKQTYFLHNKRKNDISQTHQHQRKTTSAKNPPNPRKSKWGGGGGGKWRRLNAHRMVGLADVDFR